MKNCTRCVNTCVLQCCTNLLHKYNAKYNALTTVQDAENLQNDIQNSRTNQMSDSFFLIDIQNSRIGIQF